jgi:hypothetical protein
MSLDKFEEKMLSLEYSSKRLALFDIQYLGIL